MEQAQLALISYGPHKEKYCRAKTQPGAEIPLYIQLTAAKIHLGTQPSPTLMSVTLQQVDAGVSRTHCIIEKTMQMNKTLWYLTDMSTNGTYLNQERCEFGKAYLLTSLAVVVLGDPNVSALRYQFSMGIGADLGKRLRSEAGNNTPVLVTPDQDLGDVEIKRPRLLPPVLDTELAVQDISRLESALRATMQDVPPTDGTLCVYCRKLVVIPLELPCKHIICFSCYDTIHFQNKAGKCTLCGYLLDQFRLPARNLLLQHHIQRLLSQSSLTLLSSLEGSISSRETHILSTFRLREAGYMKSLREHQEPIFSPLLSQEYIQVLNRKLKSLSPHKKAVLLRTKGLDEKSIDQADEQQLSLVMKRLKIEGVGNNAEEQRTALKQLVGKDGV